MDEPPARLSWPRLYWPSLVALSGAAAVLSFVWGREQFAGIDYSINMNGAWQMVNGRVPYHDFLTGLPLTTLTALRLAYSMAPNFQSLLIADALLAFASCIALAALATSRFGRPHAAAYVGIAAIAALHLPIGVLWHNQTTISFVLVTFACTAVVVDNATSRWRWLLPALW
ncbi:MAG: hypothetical protein MUP67_15045, partial [Acidimicrobiia bacterium]|nr:hypothetical protein [Acidimicrobiia bacterium]